ncbi:MAG: 23S rRNA (guanosine(2251)-2'-O)-methyltransferase RlmB [Acidimicrobiales bacterium]
MSPARRTGGGRGSGPSRGGRSSSTSRGKGASPSPGSSRGGSRSGPAKGGPARGGAKGPARAKGGGRAGDGHDGGGAPTGARRSPERGLGGDQVEGRQAVRELLLAGTRKVREVWVVDDRIDEGDDIAELANELHVTVRPVSRRKLAAEARTEAPQGVLAKAQPLPEVDLDDLATGRVAANADLRPTDPVPFLVALDGVTDPGNLGAVLRSAEGAGATGIVLPRHRAAHITPTVTKAAAGAIEYLPMAVVGGLPTALARLRDLGVWVVGLDMGGRPVYDLDLPADAPLCLVLGAEGAGLSRLVAQRCDVVASLPLEGRLGSLNVAAAGAVACYEVARRRRGAPGS